ncbi:hypothetical protein T439DRAFT_328751 [Meredithblackwellia eburnea MCA 4105]
MSSSKDKDGNSKGDKGESIYISISQFLHVAPKHTNQSPLLAQTRLRQLVLDYLDSNAFPDSASAFAREASLLDNQEVDSHITTTKSATASTSRSSNGRKNKSATPIRSTNGHHQPLSNSQIQPSKESISSLVMMQGVESTPPPQDPISSTDGNTVHAPATTTTTTHPPHPDADGDSVMDEAEEGEGEEGEDDDGEEEQVERSLQDGNAKGKAVAFDSEVHVAGLTGDPTSTREEDGETETGEEGVHDEVAEQEERDWPLLSLKELEQIRLRKSIRDHILRGKISQAVQLINEHFPTVLEVPKEKKSTLAPTVPSTTSSKFSTTPSITSTPAPTGNDPLHFFVPTPSSSLNTTPSLTPSIGQPTSSFAFAYPTPSSSSFTSPSSPIPILGATMKPASLSLKPEILKLNLELQSFVELIRAANSGAVGSASASASVGSPLSGIGSSPSTPLPFPTATSKEGDSPDHMSNSTSSLSSSLAPPSTTRSSAHSMSRAIKHSQKLRQLVSRLPPGKEKELWELECVDVSGLMAYTDLGICPVRGYLRQERRESLAELVNAACLQASKRTPMPIISLVTRQTTSVWNALAEWKHSFPPLEPGANPKEKRAKTYPKFDLHTYLEEKER